MTRIFRWAVASAVILTGSVAARAEVTLQVTSVQGGAALEVDFGTAQSLGSEGEPAAEPVVRQTRLSVSSNSGRPYRIFQRVNGPWTGPGAVEIPLSAIRFSVTETQTGGSNRFPTPSPLSFGEQEIFLSDSTGSAENLVITYVMQLPPGQRAGSYRATVSYQVVAQ